MSKGFTLALTLAVLFGAAACDDDDGGAGPKDAAGSETGTPNPDAGGGDTARADATTDLPAGAIGNSTGPFTAYDNPFGTGAANPAAAITGSAVAVKSGTQLTLTLTVAGMPASTTFGSHLHKLACTDNKAGGHYQHNPATDADAGADAGGPLDPAFANPTNEAWLDFTTDATGKGLGTTTVAWIPEMAAAKAIIVHAMKTGDGGVAGAKLACLPFSFFAK